MAKLRINGDTSGYVDITVPAVAGATTLDVTSPTFTGPVVQKTSGNGGSFLAVGSANQSGYLSLTNAANSRVAYVGWAGSDSGNVELATDSGTNLGVRMSTNGIERLKIDTSGRVTKPYQPAFRYHGFTINASGMQGGSAPLNIGSHLAIYAVGNANYSRFTAPIAGVYVFGISLLTNTGSGRMELIMRKNGSTTFDGYNYYAANDFSGEYTDTVNTYLISLQANDYIDWTITIGTSYTSDMNRADRQFWGYLLG